MKKKVNFFLQTLLLGILSIIISIGCAKDDHVVYNPDNTFNNTPFDSVPALNDMAVYEINIPAYSNTGGFNGVTGRLDSIKNLGINVIWLMPVYPIGTLNAIGSPYCVKNYKQVNPLMGTLDDLRKLVSNAHNKNMAVILDWVANHTSWDNPWITEHKNWYVQDGNGNIISPPGTSWTDVAELNYENNNLRAEMISSMKYWILQANVDGFRCDAADMVPASFWKQAIDSLKQLPGRDLILLAEGGNASNFQNGFQMNYAWDFASTLKSIFYSNIEAGRIFIADSVEYLNIPAGSQKLRYITNHDLYSSSSVITDYVSATGSIAAFVVTSFMRGVPLIYTGQEIAFPYTISFFQQDGIQNAFSWGDDQDVYPEYKKIMAIRNSLTCVKAGTLSTFPDEDVICFKRTLHDEIVLVIVNVRDRIVNYYLPSALTNTTWIDLNDNSTVNLTDNVSLESLSYLILKQ